MRFAVVYLPTSEVMAVRGSEVAARSRANRIADYLGFSNVKVLEVEDTTRKGDRLGISAYRPHWADIV